MICEVGRMQISAANLLLAGQQQVRGAQQQPVASSAFGAALNGKTPEVSGDGFETMLFKQTTAAPKAPAAPAVSGPAQPYATAKPPGSQIDIRV
jgi:hypothetical protein